MPLFQHRVIFKPKKCCNYMIYIENKDGNRVAAKVGIAIAF